MKFIVSAPNKDYIGVSHGVQFINGQAETADAWAVELLKEKGYEVTEVVEVSENEGQGTEDPGTGTEGTGTEDPNNDNKDPGTEGTEDPKGKAKNK